MESVLISIRPEWVQKILDGKKTIEVRKSKPKIERPFKCYIYCTKGNLSYPVGNGMICHNNGGMCVVGEFVCDKIERIEIRHFSVFGHENRYTAVGDNPDYQWLAHSCLEYNEVVQYGKLAPLYGWHISNLVIYDKPKALSEFYHYCGDFPKCDGCPSFYTESNESVGYYEECCSCMEGYKPLRRPPQSWCYVEVLKCVK